MKIKIVSIIAILFINSCTCVDWEGTREFLNAYFSSIRGKDWKIDDDCLSGKFVEYVNNLEIALATRDYIQIFNLINSIISLEREKCPVQDYSQIVKDVKTALRNGSAIKNVFKNVGNIKTRIDEYFTSDHSLCAKGSLVGSLTKIAVYGTSYSSWKDEGHNHNQ
jgi:hypothetical protein